MRNAYNLTTPALQRLQAVDPDGARVVASNAEPRIEKARERRAHKLTRAQCIVDRFEKRDVLKNLVVTVLSTARKYEAAQPAAERFWTGLYTRIGHWRSMTHVAGTCWRHDPKKPQSLNPLMRSSSRRMHGRVMRSSLVVEKALRILMGPGSSSSCTVCVGASTSTSTAMLGGGVDGTLTRGGSSAREICGLGTFQVSALHWHPCGDAPVCATSSRSAPAASRVRALVHPRFG
jgi:hypothetical protein